MGALVPQGRQPSPFGAPADRRRPRQGVHASPFHPLLATQLFTAWLAVDSWGPSGGLPCRVPPPTGQEPGGAGESSPAPSPVPPRLPAQVRLFAFVCLSCLCVPFTCAAAALSHSSLHPCPPLHSPISQLQAPIFQPGAGEAAQRGQTSSPPTLPRCLPCSALHPPFCVSRWPGRQGSYKRMGEVG